MQLIFSFVETDDSNKELEAVWQTLDPQHRATLTTTLARLMVKTIEPGEDADE